MMTECGKCHWTYPEHLLSQLEVGGTVGFRSITCCAICALDISNEFHGVKRTKFDGPIAEHMRMMCVRWRKSHPENKP